MKLLPLVLFTFLQLSIASKVPGEIRRQHFDGSLPLSIVEWILLDDFSALDQALK
jgi:hypothetical protein